MSYYTDQFLQKGVGSNFDLTAFLQFPPPPLPGCAAATPEGCARLPGCFWKGTSCERVSAPPLGTPMAPEISPEECQKKCAGLPTTAFFACQSFCSRTGNAPGAEDFKIGGTSLSDLLASGGKIIAVVLAIILVVIALALLTR